MHINKRDNGFRFQESRLRQVINFLTMATGILMVIGGIFLGSYYEHWLKGLWVAFGGVLVVVVTLLRLSVQTKLNSRNTQGRTRGQALMDFWRKKGFFATYSLEHFGDRSNWVALKDSTEECRLYAHNSGLMVTVNNEKVRIGNPGGQYYADSRQLKIAAEKTASTTVYRLRQPLSGELECSLDSSFPQDVLWAVLQVFRSDLDPYVVYSGVSIHELLHPRVDGAVPQLLPLQPLQAA